MTVSLQALVVAVLATHVCVLLGPTPTPSAHDVGTVVVGGGGVVVVVVVVGGFRKQLSQSVLVFL